MLFVHASSTLAQNYWRRKRAQHNMVTSCSSMLKTFVSYMQSNTIVKLLRLRWCRWIHFDWFLCQEISAVSSDRLTVEAGLRLTEGRYRIIDCYHSKSLHQNWQCMQLKRAIPLIKRLIYDGPLKCIWGDTWGGICEFATTVKRSHFVYGALILR